MDYRGKNGNKRMEKDKMKQQTKTEPKNGMPNFSLCDTEEEVEKLNELIDNLW